MRIFVLFFIISSLLHHFADDSMAELIQYSELELIGVSDGLSVIDSVDILYFFKLFGRGELGLGEPKLLVVNDMMLLEHS